MGKKYSRYQQGNFKPANPDKYKGRYPITYRSSWELAAFKWLDMNPLCTKWGSESICVRYFFEGDYHRYFIDLDALFKTKDGLKKFVIEIKPYKQTIPPVESKRKKKRTLLMEKRTYARNLSKWKSARDYCKLKGYTFLVITEKELFKNRA